MAPYAALVTPPANRVYGQVAGPLLRSELLAVDELLLGGVVSDASETVLGGVPYLTFETASDLDERAVSILSNLSLLHALFRREGGLLAPIEIRRADRYDDDLVTTQRYVGKTNEAFTKLLLNLTLAANSGAVERRCRGERVRLLDPVCGRGTTLNHALTYGLDALGVELEQRDVDAYATFLTTWLKEKRLKHKAETATIRRGRETAAHRFKVAIGPKRDEAQLVDLVHDDTLNAGEHFAKSSVDLLVADLPYGVQHGSQAGGRLARRPGELLTDALPVWSALLRRGAAVGLAFNLRTLPRAELLERLDAAGLEPCAPVAAHSFEHRVDRSITRDLVVAIKR